MKNQTYRHGPYRAFRINDPKPRQIHKSAVRDRLLHHAVYRVLYWHFDRRFIHDSYSCRNSKGTHRALGRFNALARAVSESNSRTCWILKGDIRQFFASINHEILLRLVRKHIADENVIWLIEQIVSSFHSGVPGVGLPLGNLTSQLLVNVYLNEFDQFLKHELKAKHYLRYADDFVIMHEDKNYLRSLLPQLQRFLITKLKLSLHPDKVFLQTLASGVDFLGWVHFPDHRVLRGVTRKRMFRNLEMKKGKEETVASYLGMLKWGNGRKLQQNVTEIIVSLG